MARLLTDSCGGLACPWICYLPQAARLPRSPAFVPKKNPKKNSDTFCFSLSCQDGSGRGEKKKARVVCLQLAAPADAAVGLPAAGQIDTASWIGN